MRSGYLQRHPKTKTVLVNAVLLGLIFIAGEIITRLTINYNPGYYTVIESKKGALHFPFGDIPINSLGHPDSEFDLSDPRPRVGYVGDSVTWGIGAGYGYRFSDLLEARFPQYQHMTLASVAEGFQNPRKLDRVVEQASSLGLDQICYFFNLNDTLADVTPSGKADKVRGWGLLHFLKRRTEFLRSRSFFFNWLRYRLRILAQGLGYQFDGSPAYEFFPEEHPEIIESTARRINSLARRLAALGVDFTVVMLPYEMEISEEAERVYASYGIEWSRSFIERGTERLLRRHLDPAIPVHEAYEAFVGEPGDRAGIRVGEYFVYNRGDALDWNHPNRAGHAKIAEYLERVNLLAPLGEATSPAPQPPAPTSPPPPGSPPGSGSP